MKFIDVSRNPLHLFEYQLVRCMHWCQRVCPKLGAGTFYWTFIFQNLEKYHQLSYCLCGYRLCGFVLWCADGYVELIVTKPGFGRLLLQRAHQQMRQMGLTVTYLSALPQACLFYERIGYEFEGRPVSEKGRALIEKLQKKRFKNQEAAFRDQDMMMFLQLLTGHSRKQVISQLWDGIAMICRL